MLGVFAELDATVAAIEDLKKGKVGDLTVFSPTPRHELEHAVHPPMSAVRKFTLVGALSGVTFGFWVAIWGSNYCRSSWAASPSRPGCRTWCSGSR